MSTLLLKGAFIASKQGKTGLTVTVDLYRIALADATSSKVVTDGAASEVGGGVYVYRYASADCATYEYVSVFKTADATVDQQHVHGQHFVMPDELISSRVAPAVAGRTLAVDVNGKVTAANALTSQQTRDALALALTPETPAPENSIDFWRLAAEQDVPAIPAAVWAVLWEGVTPQALLQQIPIKLDEKPSAQGVRDALMLAATIGGDPAAVGSVDAHLDAIQAKTDLLAAGSVAVASPVDAAGDVAIDAGYDYYAADGRGLSWTDETPATWPNLTGATAVLYVGALAVTGSISNPTGPATITVELTRAQTATLAAGVHSFHVDVTLSNTHLILQIRGTMTVS